MSHWWEWQGLDLRHFAPEEFDHPEHMEPRFLQQIDTLRERCGFPIRITDDFRTEAEMAALYGNRSMWPDSAHTYGTAIDCRPVPNTGPNRMKLVGEAWRMHVGGQWPRLGVELGIAGGNVRHLHLDSHPNRDRSRPYLWVGQSR